MLWQSLSFFQDLCVVTKSCFMSKSLHLIVIYIYHGTLVLFMIFKNYHETVSTSFSWFVSWQSNTDVHDLSVSTVMVFPTRLCMWLNFEKQRIDTSYNDISSAGNLIRTILFSKSNNTFNQNCRIILPF